MPPVLLKIKRKRFDNLAAYCLRCGRAASKCHNSSRVALVNNRPLFDTVRMCHKLISVFNRTRGRRSREQKRCQTTVGQTTDVVPKAHGNRVCMAAEEAA